MSVRTIANEVGISKVSVCKVLKKEGYHDYKPLYGQLLFDGDSDRRVQFCQAITQMLNDDPALFLRKLKFSDECEFGLTLTVNKHNVHHWAKNNPKFRIGNPLERQPLWRCGLA